MTRHRSTCRSAAGHGGTPAEPGRSDSTGPVFGAPDGVAAKVGDRSITIADVDREWQRTDPGSYIGVARRVHEMRRRVADKMVADDLLAREAAARGLSVEALLEGRDSQADVPLPDSAVAGALSAARRRARAARRSIRCGRRFAPGWRRYTEPELARDELRRGAEEGVDAGRLCCAAAADRGRASSARRSVARPRNGAAVQIVAFGDFRNGRYAAFAQAFGRVRETFGDRVRVVFKHLPTVGPGVTGRRRSGAVRQRAGEVLAVSRSRCWRSRGRRRRHASRNSPRRPASIAPRSTRAVDSEPLPARDRRGDGRSAALRRQRQPELPRQRPAGASPPPFLPPFEFFTRLVEEELVSQNGERRGSPVVRTLTGTTAKMPSEEHDDGRHRRTPSFAASPRYPNRTSCKSASNPRSYMAAAFYWMPFASSMV